MRKTFASPTIARRLELPMTREVYLDLAYLGDPPEELGPEEAELLEEFQIWNVEPGAKGWRN
jgi:hypothetical protein